MKSMMPVTMSVIVALRRFRLFGELSVLDNIRLGCQLRRRKGIWATLLRTNGYVAALPGITILITVLSVSLFGQGLNDVLNPRLRSA